MFTNRVEAGRRLAQRLAHLRGEDVVVLGLPRGGVPVAFEVAEELAAPLDVIMVRKLGTPYQPELAMGAIGEDGTRVLNPDVLRVIGIDDGTLAQVENAEREELQRRAERLRGDRPRVPLQGRTAVVVDDGIATGATAAVACRVARAQGAARVVLGVPVASPSALVGLAHVADEVVGVETPEALGSIGEFYENFSQTSDAEVTALLDRAAARSPSAATGNPGGRDADVVVPAGPVRLDGQLTVPADPIGMVVFAHGSGSSRHSPRNQYVASVLHEARLGTLLFDLLTPGEEADRRNVFDIALLADRLGFAIDWVRTELDGARLPIGLFGASTGAAAALCAAAQPGADIAAVVSRGGRPDLAGEDLRDVRAPTLLVVGGSDEAVLELNRAARAELRGPSELAVVPGATHLFEEPGTLDAAAALARDWFRQYLRVPVRTG